MRKRPTVKKATSSKLKSFKSTYKSTSALLGEVERHVVTENLEESQRNPHVIHPSEICKADTCRRAIYYRISDTPADSTGVNVSFHLQRVFDEGHDIHDKWQGWLWGMGKLYGYWECLVCDAYWYARSPINCAKCGAPKRKIRYREVPVRSDEHLISGHADGLLDEGLIEIKSVGVGTLRFEAPGFHDKLQSGEWTINETWNAIKRPFPTHIRQAMIYAYCKGIDTIIFIYEWKPSQSVKMFTVKFSEELVNPILEVCKDIKWAVEKKRPVERPRWASPDHKECKACPYRKTCYAGEIDEEAPDTQTRNRWKSKATGELVLGG